MTTLIMLTATLAVWTWAIADTVDALIQRRRRRLDREIDEAIALTQVIGPEDDPRWGRM